MLFANYNFNYIVLKMVEVNKNSQELNSVVDNMSIKDNHDQNINITFQDQELPIVNKSRTKVKFIIRMCDNAQYLYSRT